MILITLNLKPLKSTSQVFFYNRWKDFKLETLLHGGFNQSYSECSQHFTAIGNLHCSSRNKKITGGQLSHKAINHILLLHYKFHCFVFRSFPNCLCFFFLCSRKEHKGTVGRRTAGFLQPQCDATTSHRWDKKAQCALMMAMIGLCTYSCRSLQSINAVCSFPPASAAFESYWFKFKIVCSFFSRQNELFTLTLILLLRASDVWCIFTFLTQHRGVVESCPPHVFVRFFVPRKSFRHSEWSHLSWTWIQWNYSVRPAAVWSTTLKWIRHLTWNHPRQDVRSTITLSLWLQGTVALKSDAVCCTYSAYAGCFSPHVLLFACSTLIKLRHGKSSLGSCQVHVCPMILYWTKSNLTRHECSCADVTAVAVESLYPPVWREVCIRELNRCCSSWFFCCLA